MRLHNSVARSHDYPLKTLHDLVTGQDIPGFPATPDDIRTMHYSVVDRVLTALGVALVGDAQARRTLLRFHVGIATLTV
jgi:hypothetical protein